MPPSLPASFVTLIESAEIDARADYYLRASDDFRREFGVRVERVGPLRVPMVSKLDSPFFNRVAGLGLEPVTEAMLDEAIALLQENGSTRFSAPLCPLTPQAEEIAAWLEARGFTESGPVAKLFRAATPIPDAASGLRIAGIGPTEARAFAETTLAVFDMPSDLLPLMSGFVGGPGWRHYLAYDGETPVALAALYVYGETGWLGFGGTLPGYRGRGAHSALLTRRIREAVGIGCQWLVTETSPDTPEKPNPAYRNMLRFGFVPAYVRKNYHFDPSQS